MLPQSLTGWGGHTPDGNLFISGITDAEISEEEEWEDAIDTGL